MRLKLCPSVHLKLYPSLIHISLIRILSLFGLLLLTGCTALKKPNCDELQGKCHTSCEVIAVDKQILNTAQSIDRALTILAAAQEVENAPILSTGPLVTPEGGMGGTALIDWVGPIAPLVEKIAHMTGYRVKILGTEPAIPIIVTITAKRAVIADILQNASFQAARRAQILVFPMDRVIEVRYISG